MFILKTKQRRQTSAKLKQIQILFGGEQYSLINSFSLYLAIRAPVKANERNQQKLYKYDEEKN